MAEWPKLGMSALKASLWAMIVEGWLPRAAAVRPGGVALQTPDGAVSYAELLAGAGAGAAELDARGAGPGQRVAIALPPGLAFAQALHACLLLGAVAVPIDLRLTAAERERLTADAAVLVEEPLALSAGRGGADCYATARHDLESTAVVIHTSGTTSQPKPIELTYGNFLWSALGSAVALGLDSARALAVRAAALARRRPLDPAALDDLRHHCGAPRALRRRRRPRGADGAGDHARLARRHDARAPAGRGTRASTGAALRADRWRTGSTRAGGPRASGGRAGEPDLRADRVLLAGHHDPRRGAG